MSYKNISQTLQKAGKDEAWELSKPFCGEIVPEECRDGLN